MFDTIIAFLSECFEIFKMFIASIPILMSRLLSLFKKLTESYHLDMSGMDYSEMPDLTDVTSDNSYYYMTLDEDSDDPDEPPSRSLAIF